MITDYIMTKVFELTRNKHYSLGADPADDKHRKALLGKRGGDSCFLHPLQHASFEDYFSELSPKKVQRSCPTSFIYFLPSLLINDTK